MTSWVHSLNLVLTLVLLINVQESSQSPIRLQECRYIHRSRAQDNRYPAGLRQYNSHTCSQIDISRTSVTRNYTETRHDCYNYITCAGGSCQHCPCPEGETFNPITLRCDGSRAACRCPGNSQTETPVVTQTLVRSRLEEATGKTVHILTNDITSDPNQMDDQVIIMVAIVSGTVIVLVLLVVSFIVWQLQRHVKHSANVKPKSFRSCSGSSSSGGNMHGPEYLDIKPTHEYHVYAEIDDLKTRPKSHLVPLHQSTVTAPLTSPLLSSIPLLAPPSPPEGDVISHPFPGCEPIKAYHRLQSHEPPNSVSEFSPSCHRSIRNGRVDCATLQDNSYSSSSVIDCKACQELSSHSCMKSHNNLSMPENNTLPPVLGDNDAVYRPWMAAQASQA